MPMWLLHVPLQKDFSAMKGSKLSKNVPPNIERQFKTCDEDALVELPRSVTEGMLPYRPRQWMSIYFTCVCTSIRIQALVLLAVVVRRVVFVEALHGV